LIFLGSPLFVLTFRMTHIILNLEDGHQLAAKFAAPARTARPASPQVAPNSLTTSDWRDEFAGTPRHKHLPASIEHGWTSGKGSPVI
jgi:hypothetical protein